MFSSMEVLTSQGELLTLQLTDDSAGISIQDVEGLGRMKATLVSSSFAGQNGADYQGATLPPRNITMLLGIDPDPTVSTVRDLRLLIENIFDPKSQITMTFFDDEVTYGYQIIGEVEDCDPARFTQTPAMSISVMCYDPTFYDPTPVVISSLTTADTVATDMQYVGTADTGMTLTVNVNRTMSGFSLYYIDPSSRTWTLDFSYSLLAGDVVTICSIPGGKFANVFRAGTTSPALYAIPSQSIWPIFSRGSNSLRISADGAAVPASVTYTTRYGSF